MAAKIWYLKNVRFFGPPCTTRFERHRTLSVI